MQTVNQFEPTSNYYNFGIQIRSAFKFT